MNWEWHHTWWLSMVGTRTLAILTIRDSGRLIAIAPMVIRPPDYSRILPFSALEFIGSGSVGSDYLGVIARSADDHRVASIVSKELIARNHVFEIKNAERSSRIMSLIYKNMQESGCLTAIRRNSFTPCVDMSPYDWDSYMVRNGTSARSRFNKKLRKLNKDFKVRFELTTEEGNVQINLSTMIGLHLKRWRDKGGTNAFNTVMLRNFHHQFSAIALRNNWLRLFIIWLNDVPAAAVYGFYYQRTFYYYQAGFNPDFSRYSVGYLAIGLTIRHAFSEGAKEYDFLHGDEGYKYVWSNSVRELLSLNIFPVGFKGYLCKRTVALRNSVKDIFMSESFAHSQHGNTTDIVDGKRVCDEER
jgi:CelD/BcsL family acetyltransferase involved in cellulose biosynthesis